MARRSTLPEIVEFKQRQDEERRELLLLELSSPLNTSQLSLEATLGQTITAIAIASREKWTNPLWAHFSADVEPQLAGYNWTMDHRKNALVVYPVYKIKEVDGTCQPTGEWKYVAVIRDGQGITSYSMEENSFTMFPSLPSETSAQDIVEHD